VSEVTIELFEPHVQLAMNITPVSDLDDRHGRQGVVDLVGDPKGSLPDAVLLLTTELLAAGWARVNGERADALDDSPALLTG
jgi:hypothetical protein